MESNKDIDEIDKKIEKVRLQQKILDKNRELEKERRKLLSGMSLLEKWRYMRDHKNEDI